MGQSGEETSLPISNRVIKLSNVVLGTIVKTMGNAPSPSSSYLIRIPITSLAPFQLLKVK